MKGMMAGLRIALLRENQILKAAMANIIILNHLLEEEELIMSARRVLWTELSFLKM